MSDSTHIPKLPYPPLQEVIFEAKWRLVAGLNEQMEFDPEYETSLGLFKKNLQKKFPHYERLNAQRLPYNVEHRFWSKGKDYPLIQYGPGILAINETDKNYQWKANYFPTISFALKQLLDSYDEAPIFVEATLRYIDSVVINDKNPDLLDFINQNLQTSVQKKFKVPGELLDINLVEAYRLKDNSILQLNISSGFRKPKQERVVVWQNSISTSQEMSLKEMKNWLSSAHKTASNLFKQMVSQKFYETFTHE